jgi:hypothetical protein
MSRDLYGAKETNGLSDMSPEARAEYWKRVEAKERIPVLWTEPHLRVTRLRLVSDIGFPVWDVSYCQGEIREPGKPVRYVDVALPFDQLPRGKTKAGKGAMVGAILEYARKDKVYAKGLGILDAISTLV